jgi:RHS repeat-associated protein
LGADVSYSLNLVPWQCLIGTYPYAYQAFVAACATIPPATYYVVAAPPPLAQTRSPDPVGEPIDPSTGNVYAAEIDVNFASPGAIQFRWFYSSIDTAGADGVPGWRHSYDRYIGTVYQTASKPYPGQSASVSPQYSTAASACTAGFATIQSAVPGWSGATAIYNNGVCILSKASATIGTLLIQSSAGSMPPAAPIEYDVIRDDGQTLRFTLQNGAINNPPGISVRLAVSGSGFTVTDDLDNVENYNAAGVLLSITSRAGVMQTISYDGNGRLYRVIDSFGNSLTVARNAAQKIGSITLNNGGLVQYGYGTNGQLATVTNFDSTTRKYVYANTSFPYALTGETDESNVQYLSWDYDSQGRGKSTQMNGGTSAQILVYNPNGSVTATDALGAVRTFSYTRSGDINRVSAITGSQCPSCRDSATTTYDGAGWVASRTDYNGNLTCYANDPVRGLELVRVEGFSPGSTCPANLSSYTPVAGTLQRKTTRQWSATWREPTLITEPERTTAYTLDSHGNVHIKTVTDTSVTPNVARTWTYTYNSYGQVLTIDGPRTDLTTLTYYTCTTGYQCGQVNTITNALSQVTTFDTYNAYGRPLTITDPNNVVTTLAYDARQRLTSRQVGTETTTYSYYPTGLLKLVTLPDSSTILYGYDGAHRLTDITDGLGDHIHYTLDALGNHTADNTYDPGNSLRRTHTRVFNTLDELYKDINAADTAAVTTTFGYDPNGNRTSIAAPLSRDSMDTYDARNRLAQITDPAGGITVFGYDANDNLASVKDPRNLTTTYTHDGFNEVTHRVSPDTGTSTKTYDASGNLQTTTDARGAVGTYTHDALNRVTKIAYTDQTIQFTYDAGTNGKGRLTGASDANHSMSLSYDTHGRVTGKSQTTVPVTKSVGYSYTNADMTSLVMPSGQTITYSYNNHRITSVKVNSTTLLNSVTYFPFGPVSGWTWGNASTVSRTYDTDGKVSHISTAGDGLTFGYDNAFRISSLSDTLFSSSSYTAGYDALDRLNSLAQTGVTSTWTYDADGNHLTQTGTSSVTTTPSTTSNRLNSIGGGIVRTYAYDAAGNTLSYTGASFGFNQRGRMSSATVGSTGASYIYNALGQLVKKTVGGVTTLLVYDEAGHLLGEYSSTGALIQETVWMDNTPVATLRPNGSTVTIYYVHTDHLNAPRVVTQSSDNSVRWLWGGNAANQNPLGLGTFVYNLRYPGQYFQAETGLSYNYFRDYDGVTGRYLESDPIGLSGGVNSYVYVGGNPISNTDPFGLWTFQFGIGGSLTTPWGGSITLSGGIAFDGHGNIALYETAGPGMGIGAGESAGGTMQFSANAQTVNDLTGQFNTVSAGAGAGLSGTIDGFTGTTADGRIVSGAGITIGEGIGVTSFNGFTYTAIQPIGNVCQ